MPDSDRFESELASILVSLTDSTIEQRPGLDELTAAHPHLATELRELWGTIMVVEAVAQNSPASGSNLSSGGSHHRSDPAAGAGRL